MVFKKPLTEDERQSMKLEEQANKILEKAHYNKDGRRCTKRKQRCTKTRQSIKAGLEDKARKFIKDIDRGKIKPNTYKMCNECGSRVPIKWDKCPKCKHKRNFIEFVYEASCRWGISNEKKQLLNNRQQKKKAAKQQKKSCSVRAYNVGRSINNITNEKKWGS